MDERRSVDSEIMESMFAQQVMKFDKFNAKQFLLKIVSNIK